MKLKAAITALVVAGVAAGIAVYAWPASAKLPKPVVIHSAAPLQLPVLRTLHGIWDAHDFNPSQLVPPGSRVDGVWYAPSRGYHQQVLVQWTDLHKYVVWNRINRTARWGLTLWSSVKSRWRAVKIPVIVVPGPTSRVSFADVTGDGRPDLLFEQNPTGGSGSCGPHRIYSTSLRGVTTRVFSAGLCDASLGADHGLLAFVIPVDLQPEPHCCPEFYEHLHLRWNGHRFVQDSLHIEKSGLY